MEPPQRRGPPAGRLVQGLTPRERARRGPLLGGIPDTAAHGRHDLGRSVREVRATVERLVADLAERPLTVEADPGSGGPAFRLDDTVLPLVLSRWLTQEDDDVALARTVRSLVDQVAGRPAAPTPELVEQLAFLDVADPMLDNGLAAAWASLCHDGSWPTRLADYRRAVERSRDDRPVFGPLAENVQPCARWAATGAPPPRIADDVPLLMVQAADDVATPLSGARALHRRPTGSRLVTADVRAHGTVGRAADGYAPIPCIDRAVRDHLTGAPLPPTDRRC